MNKKIPKVTVLMPVYNGELFLRESIESILNQSFKDFEFVIIDDGSKDKSVEIIKTYGDPRIRLVRNEKNIGLITTLNRGLDIAKGEYVARMDCDDISLPTRLEKQVTHMDNNKELGICGTWFKTFNDGRNIEVCNSIDHNTMKCKLFFDICLGHPTVMMRLSFFNKYNLRYDIKDLHAEDYGLFARSSFIFSMANYPEVLVNYRVSSESICKKYRNEQMDTVLKINKENIGRLGIENIDDKTFSIHKKIVFNPSGFSKSEELLKADEWLCRLREANRKKRCYPDIEFSNILLEKWAYIYMCSVAVKTQWGKRIYSQSLLHRGHRLKH